MRKSLVLALCVLALVAALPRESQAAGPFNFYIRGGVITDQNLSFSPFLWTIGANLDLNLGPILTLSPECDIIVYQFDFSPLWLAPAVLLNLRFSALYVGAGVGIFALLGSGGTLTSDPLFKLNGGIKLDSIKVQAYLYTPFDAFFSSIGIGATLGFGF